MARIGSSAVRSWLAHGRGLPLLLLGLFLAAAATLAVAPYDREDWLLENAVVAVAVPLLVWGFRTLRFSNASYAALFVFLLLHEIGAHYTYSQVPYDSALAALSGFSVDHAFGFSRNQFDRFVHFMYGLLVTPAAAELFALRAPSRGAWRRILPVSFVMSHSVLYELLEWAAALIFGGDLGVAYLGTQGDVWDAQKDMALVAAGSIVAMALLAIVRRRWSRHGASGHGSSARAEAARSLRDSRCDARVGDRRPRSRGRCGR
jgi:putative membrane protein